jgi:hypothetical protein
MEAWDAQRNKTNDSGVTSKLTLQHGADGQEHGMFDRKWQY